VIDEKGKLKILNTLIEDLKVDQSKIAVVADDWNNLQMYDKSNLFLGFNPDPRVAAKADHVVHGYALKDISNKILNKESSERDKISKELITRKTIHILGALIIPFALVFGMLPSQLLIMFLSLLYLISEYFRINKKKIPLITKITNTSTSKSEQLNIVLDPIWYAFGIIVTLSFFPIKIATVGILTLTMGDSFAGFVGRMINRKHKIIFNKSKTIEGSITGMLIASLFSSLLINPLFAIPGCIGGMIIESLPLPISDNVSIPIISSMVTFFLLNVTSLILF
jgi:dolichol kinase